MGAIPTCILHPAMLLWNRQGVSNDENSKQFVLEIIRVAASRHGSMQSARIVFPNRKVPGDYIAPGGFDFPVWGDEDRSGALTTLRSPYA